MIIYKSCKDVSMKEIFQAFEQGFSDYIINLKMDMKSFEERFFGPEGNSLQNSFIAFDNERAIGVMLGGIRNFDGQKTMRCGTLCVDLQYRRKGVGQELFELHRKKAIEEGCTQLFLEVIKGNDKAVNFYKSKGYETVYNLKYFSKNIEDENFEVNDLKFKDLDFEHLMKLRESLCDIHINWQSEPEYFANIPHGKILGAYENDKLIGVIAQNPQGKIYFIWVLSEYRNRGIGRIIVYRISKEQNISKANISTSNNNYLEGFLKKIGFKKEDVEQFEMYLWSNLNYD